MRKIFLRFMLYGAAFLFGYLIDGIEGMLFVCAGIIVGSMLDR